HYRYSIWYRLSHPLSIGQIQFDQDQSPIALEPFTFSPYNTQNTITYYEAFWGLYLPITTTFRVCDIWRSFWVQRLLWDIGGRLVFGRSTIKQVRNSHSFIKDMNDEYQLYHQSGSSVRFLVSWSSSQRLLSKRIGQLARDIAQAGFWQPKEVDIMNAWLADLHSVGYSFPSIVLPFSSSSPSIIQKRAAVCVTGFAECIQEAWVPTYSTICNHLQGDIDVFLFLSSSRKSKTNLFDINLKQIRSYLDSTVTILYEDRIIDPHIPLNCKKFYNPNMDRSHVMPYYQQLWGLAECFDLVKEYEQKMNIRYEFLIRARSDSVLDKVPRTLEPQNNLTLVIPNEYDFGGYNDRFAIGSMSIMKKYMRRWHDLSRCYVENLHAESFLKLFLNRFNISVQLIKRTNIEVQIRKIYEPHLYPNAPVLPLFKQIFGNYSNEVCSVGFEANPLHDNYLKEFENYCLKRNWRVKIFTSTAVSIIETNLTFYTKPGNEANNQWGKSLEASGKKSSISVPSIDIVSWFKRAVLN
ncbi:unnamed protein product, partial [Rotaria sordida]